MHRIDACPRPAAAPDKSEESADEAIAKRAAKGGKWFEDMCEKLAIKYGVDPRDTRDQVERAGPLVSNLSVQSCRPHLLAQNPAREAVR